MKANMRNLRPTIKEKNKIRKGWNNVKDFLLLIFLLIVLIHFLQKIDISVITNVFASSRTVVIVNNEPENASSVKTDDSAIRVQAEDGGGPEQSSAIATTTSKSVKTFDSLLKKYFGDEWKIAQAVMMAESSGDPGRVGDTHMDHYSYGLFQINRTWHKYPADDLKNPEFNIRIAKEIRDSGGWERWTTYRTGQYKDFLIN